jgi:hypothetical protein
MLSIPGFDGLKRILWKDIEPGMIIIGGLKINGTTLPELFNYPALTVGQIYEFTQKYHLKKNKEIIVAVCKKGESPQKMSKGFSTLEKRIQSFNDWRNKILQKKIELNKHNIIIHDLEIVNQNYKFLGNYNSFSPKRKLQKLKPSLFHNMELLVTPGHVISGEYKKSFYLPEDFPLFIQMGIVYTENFKEAFLSDFQIALDLFSDLSTNLLERSKFEIYAIGSSLREAQYPLSGREVDGSEIFVANFLKRALHKKNKDLKNLCILILPEKPKDWEETLKTSEKLKKAAMDSILILSGNWEEKDVLLLKNNFHCNLVYLKELKYLCLVLLEVFDLFLSESTIDRIPITIPDFQEFPIPNFPPKEEPPKEKVVKPYEFKKVKRKLF